MYVRFFVMFLFLFGSSACHTFGLCGRRGCSFVLCRDEGAFDVSFALKLIVCVWSLLDKGGFCF